MIFVLAVWGVLICVFGELLADQDAPFSFTETFITKGASFSVTTFVLSYTPSTSCCSDDLIYSESYVYMPTLHLSLF